MTGSNQPVSAGSVSDQPVSNQPVSGRPVPLSDRPRMYGRSGLDPVLLPWRWAERRLVSARGYWIATTRPDGRPHTRPVWGVWTSDGLYFSTGSLAARNLAHSPDITVHLDSAAEVVIVEGTASRVTDPVRAGSVSAAYAAKYQWDNGSTSESVPAESVSEPGLESDAEEWWHVTPHTVFGWIVDQSGEDGGACFHGSTTRWRWPSTSD